MQTILKESILSLIKQTKLVPLIKKAPTKPLDTGSGNLAASLGLFGDILSVSAYHERHGWIVANNIPQFPADKYYDPLFVREYRKALADLNQPGFGLTAGGEMANVSYYWLGGSIPMVQGKLNGVKLTTFSWAEGPKKSKLLQVLLLENGSETQEITLNFQAPQHLSRAAYGQLTERGPVIPPQPDIRFSKETAGKFKLSNLNLPAEFRAQLWGELPGVPSEKSARLESYHLSLAPNQNKIILGIYQLAEKVEPLNIESEWLLQSLNRKLADFPQKLIRQGANDRRAYVVLRNLDYILSCCAVPTDDSVCLLTDHQLLPLAWNRDAYYQIKLVREYYAQYKKVLTAKQRRRLKKVCQGHLNWLYQKAERNPFWGRSHLATGKIKDETFQLDQQCYPIIELGEYGQVFGDDGLVRKFYPAAAEVATQLLEMAEGESFLLPTEETPADDALELPYHFSSQLLWLRALEMIDYMRTEFLDKGLRFKEIRKRLTAEIWKRLVTDFQGRPLFAYAVDLEGQKMLYQDANDLPTVFCPEWGFCDSRSEIWRNTIGFAFSPANKGGFYPGEFAGLGSIHTAQPWPLGDLQKLIFGRLTQNGALQQKATNKLFTIIQADGLLPEAVNAKTGEIESRHWFSWPGSVFSSELLRSMRDETKMREKDARRGP